MRVSERFGNAVDGVACGGGSSCEEGEFLLFIVEVVSLTEVVCRSVLVLGSRIN